LSGGVARRRLATAHGVCGRWRRGLSCLQRLEAAHLPPVRHAVGDILFISVRCVRCCARAAADPLLPALPAPLALWYIGRRICSLSSTLAGFIWAFDGTDAACRTISLRDCWRVLNSCAFTWDAQTVATTHLPHSWAFCSGSRRYSEKRLFLPLADDSRYRSSGDVARRWRRRGSLCCRLHYWPVQCYPTVRMTLNVVRALRASPLLTIPLIPSPFPATAPVRASILLSQQDGLGRALVVTGLCLAFALARGAIRCGRRNMRERHLPGGLCRFFVLLPKWCR